MYYYCLIIHFCCISVASTQLVNNVFCVTQNNYSDKACQGYNSSEYHDLLYYMNHNVEYFKSNQTYIFEHGKHSPLDNFTLKIKHKRNLVLVGQGEVERSEAAIIDCNGGSTKFLFQYFSNIIVANLTFSACTVQRYSSTKHPSATLVFITGYYLQLLSIKILTSVDEAFYIENTCGDLVLSNVEVSHANTAGKTVWKAGNAITYRYCNARHTSNLFITDSTFVNNSNFVDDGHHAQLYAGGLSINLQCPNIRVRINNLTMSNNTGGTGGNIAFYFYTKQNYFNVSVTILNSKFEGGYATEGAGMFAEFVTGLFPKESCKINHQDHMLLLVYNTTFNDNTAQYAGGGVYLKQKQSLSSCNKKNITFINVTLNNNLVVKTDFGGIAFHSINFMVTGYLLHEKPQYYVILVNSSVHSNSVIHHNIDGSGTGAIFTKSNHFFKIDNTSVFNNRATGLLGMSSNIILSRNISIVNNTGSSGGGLLLCQNAVIYLDAYTNVTIAYNAAYHTGGGICIETESKPVSLNSDRP